MNAARILFVASSRWWLASLPVLLALLLCAPAHADDRAEPTQTLRTAVLQSLAGTRAVTLPHVLKADDFAPGGGRVRYRLEVNLPAAPDEQLGIYVRKMSLSGQIYVNGQLLGACETGVLEEQRCLHKPYLFLPPIGMWRAGANVIEFDIYANDRQMNGLAPLLVGPARQLDRAYFLSRLWRVESVHGLSWATLCLGLLALAVWVVLRDEAVYLWFGLASIADALSNVNVLVSHPMVGFEFFSWLVFSTRLVSMSLLLLTLLAFFGKITVLRRRVLVAYTIALPLIVWLSGNSRSVTTLLYVPLMIGGLTVLLAMMRWTYRTRQPLHVLVTLSFSIVGVAGLLDWLRLSGEAAFEGVYLMAYANTGIMLVFGSVLVGLLASALSTSRKLTATLDREVGRRTADLEKANRQLAELSATDGLTGIANRRHFDDALADEWSRAQRQGHPLSLLLIDLDQFKAYNDHYGHLPGDECLRRVAMTLDACARRSGDLAARYGGEEFAIIVAADASGAQQFAESVRAEVESLALPHAGSPFGHITISVGVATVVPDEASNPRDLLARADAALYQAKAGGRNRVRVGVVERPDQPRTSDSQHRP